MQDWAEEGSLLEIPVAVRDIAAGQGLAGAICTALYHRAMMEGNDS